MSTPVSVPDRARSFAAPSARSVCSYPGLVKSSVWADLACWSGSTVRASAKAAGCGTERADVLQDGAGELPGDDGAQS